MTDMQSQEAEAVLHCQGRLLRISDRLMDEAGEVLYVSSALPGAHEMRLHDIGREGRVKRDMRGRVPNGCASDSISWCCCGCHQLWASSSGSIRSP